ncbi:MAG: hydroxylamine oxidation protein HaoB [Arenicellales bacterium]|nr:hydroxylamine oxidation protein HaoB [Arenicellales bacterium]
METSASVGTTNISATRSRALPIASAMLVIGGLLLLGWVGWSVLNPAPAPYHYELVAEGATDRFPELGLSSTDISISQYELRVDKVGKALATLYVGEHDRSDMGPVLLDWQNQIDEPLITITPPITEFSNLVAVAKEHLPEQAVVLGWWDTSRRLELLSGIDTLFSDHLTQPLIIPDVWRDRRRVIEETERRFWRISNTKNLEDPLFKNFQEALLADQKTGLLKLKALVQGREAYLVLHVSDAFKLGMANPERLAIGYKDFPNTGNIHVVSGHVKKWLKEQGYESFTAERRGSTSSRIYFLADPESTNTLIAQALPFSTSRPFELKNLSIVYQSSGYWVYKILNNDD